MVDYWHGGVPRLRVGDLIEPGHERAFHDGCPTCEARRAQDQGGPAPTIDGLAEREDRVYLTTERLYAKHYASLYGRGWLYRVEPVGEVEPSTEDTIPTFLAPTARVLSVYERAVLLTMSERRRLYRMWSLADAIHDGRSSGRG